jgi:hypothetical protein
MQISCPDFSPALMTSREPCGTAPLPSPPLASPVRRTLAPQPRNHPAPPPPTEGRPPGERACVSTPGRCRAALPGQPGRAGGAKGDGSRWWGRGRRPLPAKRQRKPRPGEPATEPLRHTLDGPLWVTTGSQAGPALGGREGGRRHPKGMMPMQNAVSLRSACLAFSMSGGLSNDHPFPTGQKDMRTGPAPTNMNLIVFSLP